MSNYMLFTFLIVIGIILIYLFNKYYAFGLVSGNSMMPEYKSREIFFIKRNYSLNEGKVYVINVDGYVAIKRLNNIGINQRTAEIKLWFIGDNADNSVDSRNWGWIEKDRVIGEVVKIWRK